MTLPRPFRQFGSCQAGAATMQKTRQAEADPARRLTVSLPAFACMDRRWGLRRLAFPCPVIVQICSGGFGEGQPYQSACDKDPGNAVRDTHWEVSMLDFTRRLALAAVLVPAALVAASPASAQTKLKWAHVYEIAEPYHTEALWAAEEIKKRTSGRYEIGVFPASQLGNENQINEGLGLGTVDIIYTGTSFAGSIHKPLAISGAPFMLRDFDHWKAYRESKLFRDLSKGYEDKTRHKIIALTYYGERMVTANKEIKKPDDMKGMKLRVPPAPLYLMLAKSVGANATPIAFAEVYLALQQGTVDGQENPLPTIMAKKFYEVQSHVMLTGHITESLLTIVGTHVWSKLSDADKKVFEEVLMQAAAKASDQIRSQEQKIADELRKLGKNVVTVDRESFRQAAVKLHNDASSGAGWSQAEYDAFQALK
jgi:tripartite ATP-independent transporter DctP family solute receptor